MQAPGWAGAGYFLPGTSSTVLGVAWTVASKGLGPPTPAPAARSEQAWAPGQGPHCTLSFTRTLDPLTLAQKPCGRGRNPFPARISA